MPELWIPLVIAILTNVAAIATAILTQRAKGQDTNRQERADLMAANGELIENLQRQLDLNNQELARLREELREMRLRLEEERAAYDRDRQALQARIEELEKINAKLEAQVTELQLLALGSE
jgi:predicted  nucleic acid-binding Zn-ribbon protein